MTKSTFEQVIAEDGVLIYTNVGNSMYPLIKPRDLLVIKPPVFPLKRLDIPLYKRDNGQYVLHRIVKVRGNEYWMCGDNRVEYERGITDRHVIGMLTDIIRDGETFSVYSLKYRVYAHLWSDFRPVKRVVFRIRRMINKKVR